MMIECPVHWAPPLLPTSLVRWQGAPRGLAQNGKTRKRNELDDEQIGQPIFEPLDGWTWRHFDCVADLASRVTKGKNRNGKETVSDP